MRCKLVMRIDMLHRLRQTRGPDNEEACADGPRLRLSWRSVGVEQCELPSGLGKKFERGDYGVCARRYGSAEIGRACHDR